MTFTQQHTFESKTKGTKAASATRNPKSKDTYDIMKTDENKHQIEELKPKTPNE